MNFWKDNGTGRHPLFILFFDLKDTYYDLNTDSGRRFISYFSLYLTCSDSVRPPNIVQLVSTCTGPVKLAWSVWYCTWQGHPRSCRSEICHQSDLHQQKNSYKKFNRDSIAFVKKLYSNWIFQMRLLILLCQFLLKESHFWNINFKCFLLNY